MKSSVRNISLTSYEDIFRTDETREDFMREKVLEIPLAELFPFNNHPFKVLDDEAMRNMVESIEKFGVLVPGVARPRMDGGYELIAGHRRKRGCELAGKETMPVIVRELDDDAATIIMVDSNLQREALLPSERAFAYKMKLEAMKRQAGRPTKENGSQVGNHFSSKKSSEILAEQTGESKNQIFRYIRLTELVPELLDMVDEKKISFNSATELSYLQKIEQTELLNSIVKCGKVPLLSQARQLKRFKKDDNLTTDVINAIMSTENKSIEKVSITINRLKKYFPSTYTPKQMEDTIIKLLEDWRKHRK